MILSFIYVSRTIFFDKKNFKKIFRSFERSEFQAH